MKIAAGRMSAAGILIISSFSLPPFLSATTGPKNLTFGVYGAWSLAKLDPMYGGGWREDFDIDLSLGAYVQYNISPKFSVQVNGNYQRGKRDWGFLTYEGNELIYIEGTDRFQFVSLNVNGVFNESRWKTSVFYLLAGGGITTGDWSLFSGVYFNLTAGAGVKVFLTSSPPKIALNIGGTFVHLIDPQEYGTQTADYFKFQVGIEF